MWFRTVLFWIILPILFLEINSFSFTNSLLIHSSHYHFTRTGHSALKSPTHGNRCYRLPRSRRYPSSPPSLQYHWWNWHQYSLSQRPWVHSVIDITELLRSTSLTRRCHLLRIFGVINICHHRNFNLYYSRWSLTNLLRVFSAVFHDEMRTTETTLTAVFVMSRDAPMSPSIYFRHLARRFLFVQVTHGNGHEYGRLRIRHHVLSVPVHAVYMVMVIIVSGSFVSVVQNGSRTKSDLVDGIGLSHRPNFYVPSYLSEPTNAWLIQSWTSSSISTRLCRLPRNIDIRHGHSDIAHHHK